MLNIAGRVGIGILASLMVSTGMATLPADAAQRTGQPEVVQPNAAPFPAGATVTWMSSR